MSQSPQQSDGPGQRVLVLAEDGGHHVEFSRRARTWLDAFASDSNLTVDYLAETDAIHDAFLDRYGLVLQLDYPPFGWTPTAAAAFERYVDEGRGGWVGLHHASLLGEFDGFPMWQWFSNLLGGIRYRSYISSFASGIVRVEDA